ncbi:MAG: hemolysin family protein [Pyrinomonadaceae bacterium]|nr:hemolysin family protein [Pyrinomonadaceae bacterium]MCX7639522.1 hemolysin family protein [Pyrinomonadaceae bacterium]MDW8304427.1 hemolysin family protein [Acidobacteriota bacterium]
MQLEIIIAALILFLLVFLATVDMSFMQLSDVSLRKLLAELEEDTSLSRSSIRKILENRLRFRFALSASIQILLIIFATLVALIVYKSRVYRTAYEMFFISLAIALVFSGIFRQILPRFIAWYSPEKRLLFLLPFVRPLYGFMSFIADPFEKFLVRRKVSKNVDEQKEEDEEDIQALIEVGKAEGIIEEEERKMIEAMIGFLETRVLEIMTPRTEICALSIDSTVRDARDLIIEEKYSRIPVYRETIDNVEGVIYVRDLLTAWSEGRENDSVENFLRAAFFVPETKKVSELLKDMQSNHIQLAIVIDEYGGVAGLVTVEDILEEIVGEIEDEDIEQEEIIEIVEGEGGYYDVLGSTEISKLERLLDVSLDNEEATTVAGLVVNQLGYVPKPRERFIIQGLDVEILRSDEKKIHLLRIRRTGEENN